MKITQRLIATTVMLQFKRNMQLIRIISGVLFTVLLWHIGFWDEKNIPFPFNQVDLPGQFYSNWLVPYKIRIGILSGVIVILIQLIGIKNPFKTRKKKILNAIQNHYINDNFNGNNDNHRITIYKAKKGFKIYLMYFNRCFIKNWRLHKEKNLLKFCFFKKFPKPFREYLVQHTRNGHPFPNGSSTYFIVPENDREVSSIASEAFFKERPKKIDLPQINSEIIDKIDDFNKYKGNQKSKIKKYMKDGKVNSFEMLKSFHRFPTKIYADPIILNNEKKWGCIVFDSDDNNLDFEKSYNSFVNHSKIVNSIISNLNN